MVTAAECREATDRWARDQRDAFADWRDRCEAYWTTDPRRWACFAARTAARIAFEAALLLRRGACQALDIAEEVVDLGRRLVDRVVIIFDHLVGVITGRNDTGYWPIIASRPQVAPSRPRPRASSRSIVMGSPMRLAEVDPYEAEGAPLDFQLIDGVVHWSIDGAPFTPFRPVQAAMPPFAPAVSGPTMVSYNRIRLGDWGTPPLFDMVAAAGDRVMAKAVGTDDVFMAVVEDPYVHRSTRGADRRLPQSFFKLDPECGLATADRADLLAHVRLPNDDETHPATERFPLFRAAFGNPSLFLDLMDVRMAPRVWHRIDARPRKDTADPSRLWPRYAHVTYRSNAFGNVAKRSIAYVRVLDLGVGVSHLHEQHEPRFGGEMDSLSGRGGVFGEVLAPVRGLAFGSEAFADAYRLANGPITDFGGWVDGTCIYFMLVQLKTDAQIARTGLTRAFAVLWIDEQVSFTERWRALDLDDDDFTSPFQPMLGIARLLGEEFYPDAEFSVRRFWSPFVDGHVTRDSRMAVARQIVAVTGRDPRTGAGEIYTVHFAWGSMDKTWRRRALPPAPAVAADAPQPAGDADVRPATLEIRDDATLALKGFRRLDGKLVEGRWFQPTLPADGQERPSVAALAGQRPGAGPTDAYDHPWDFMDEAPYQVLHRRFGRFGVMERLTPRVQAYRLTMLRDGSIPREAIEGAVWEDRAGALQLDHRRLDYAAAAATIEAANAFDPALFDSLRRTIETSSRPSTWNPVPRFRLRFVEELGWTMTFADLRDDKLIGFTNLPRHVTLTALGAQRRVITVRVDAWLRNTADRHGRTVASEVDAVSAPQVREASVSATLDAAGDVARVEIAFTLARNPAARFDPAYASFAEWAAMNVHRVKLGVALPDRTAPPLMLLDAVRADLFTADATGTTFTGVRTPTAADQRGGLLARALSPAGRIRLGTCLWFTGGSGLGACADETRFVQA